MNCLKEGYDSMLTQSHRSIGAGERITITLRFLRGQSVTVQFVVHAVNARENATTQAPMLATTL
jgi:copper(I)-binding protein